MDEKIKNLDRIKEEREMQDAGLIALDMVLDSLIDVTQEINNILKFLKTAGEITDNPMDRKMVKDYAKLFGTEKLRVVEKLLVIHGDNLENLSDHFDVVLGEHDYPRRVEVFDFLENEYNPPKRHRIDERLDQAETYFIKYSEKKKQTTGEVTTADGMDNIVNFREKIKNKIRGDYK